MEEERFKILNMIQTGQIDTEQATQLLASLEAANDPEPSPPRTLASDAQYAPGRKWSDFWIYPLMAGGGMLVLGALAAAWLSSAGLALPSCVCGWFPMLLGLLIVFLAWWSRSARWLHLRISGEGRRRIALSFPLPLSLAAWVLRFAQPFLPQLAETGVDDLLIALRDADIDDEALFIDVQDEEDGEHVQVYIG
jgi:hypothetical protein